METIRYFHQPNISESLGNGWYTMKKYFLYLFLAVFISGLFDGGMNSGSKFEFNQNDFGNGFDWQPILQAITPALIIFGLIFFALILLIRSVISYGADLMFIQAVRDQKPDIKNLFIGFRNSYMTIVLSNLLVSALVGIGLMIFIIPGIVVACRLAFVSYLVMDKGMNTIEAVETSWNMTRGHGWSLFGLGFMSIFIFIGGLLILIVGAFASVIWIKSSFASLYQAILTQKVEAINRDDAMRQEQAIL